MGDELRPVYIKWIDSTAIGSTHWVQKYHAWDALSDDDLGVIESVCCLITEDDRFVLVAMGASADNFESPCVIPKSAIVEMRKLEFKMGGDRQDD